MALRDAKDRILDAAEDRARLGGYNGFSFRDLADDVGVKSASVHYHFPTKGDLAAALADRYAAKARARLGDPATLTARKAIEEIVSLFRDSLMVEDRMCLCGVFGAERDMLPPEVNAVVARYFEMLLRYLETAFGPDWDGPSPASIVSRLEGALILARTLEAPEQFDSAIGDLVRSSG